MQSEADHHGQSDHLDESLWERLALGELDEGAKDRALDHASRCTECGRILRGLQALEREAIEVDSARSPVLTVGSSSVGSSRWLLGAAAVAAGVLVAVSTSMLLTPTPSGGLVTERSASEHRPKTLVPDGALDQPPDIFRWEPAVANRSYSVELLDEQGAPIWRSDELVTAQAPWPSDIPTLPGRYYWRVWESDEEGNVTASVMTSFDIPQP